MFDFYVEELRKRKCLLIRRHLRAQHGWLTKDLPYAGFVWWVHQFRLVIFRFHQVRQIAQLKKKKMKYKKS